MKIVYIKLKGYAGIYNGMGLNEIEIDLSNAKHKICVISGINGCGKTTLLNALSFLPDKSTDFIKGVSAEKHIKAVDGENFYEATIISTATANGRGVTKGSIIKNGVELNPNGNITSYKDIIFNEFDLDANYATLTKLSNEDRGLADKSPSERKKYIASIMDYLVTYNDMYKTLNKKSSIFKTYVSNLHNKINNIGDRDIIEQTLSLLEEKRKTLNDSLEAIKKSIIEAQTIIGINGNNDELLVKFNNLDDEVKATEQLVKELEERFKQAESCITVPEDMTLSRSIESLNTLILTTKTMLDKNSKEHLEYIREREECRRNLEDLQTKLDSLSKGIDTKLSEQVEEMRNKVIKEREILSSSGLSNPDNASTDELKLILKTITNVVSYIDDMRNGISEDDLLFAIRNDFDRRYIVQTQEKIDNQKKRIDDLRSQCTKAKYDIKSTEVLSEVPEKCRNSNCVLLSAAQSVMKEYEGSNPEDRYKELAVELERETKVLEKLVKDYEYVCEAEVIRNKYDNITCIVADNIDILSKIPIGTLFASRYVQYIKSFNSFNEFRDLEALKVLINTLSLYKKDITVLNRLESLLSSQNTTESEIRNIKANIDKYSNRIVDLHEAIEKLQDDSSRLATELDRYDKEITKQTSTMDCRLHLEEAKTRLENYVKERDDILNKSKTSLSLLENIASMTIELNQGLAQLENLDKQISSYRSNLSMMNNYTEEYEMYSAKYNMTEVLKKHCSPSTGIQTLFINVYMHKTLDLANQILSLAFGENTYQILDFVITNDEFRIPFVGSGMVVDDISYGSTSQICMIGMAINLALHYQASTKCNYARLDEIDGGLDSKNRMRFINDVLTRMLELTHVEQLFLISHSTELEMSNADMILLKSYSDYEIPEANILYNFRNQH